MEKNGETMPIQQSGVGVDELLGGVDINRHARHATAKPAPSLPGIGQPSVRSGGVPRRTCADWLA